MGHKLEAGHKDISVPVSEINDLDSICRGLDRHLKKDASKLRDASVRDRGRKLVQHTRHLITSPDGEFACEANPLIAQLEEQIRVADAEAKVADARAKKGKIVWWSVAVLVIVIGSIVIYSVHQAGLEARLEAERESERRSLALLSVREEFRLAQAAGGPVVAWGSNLNAQTTVPAGLEDVVQISCGGYHSLALREDGKVVAWGNKNYGQTTVPAGLEDVVQIAAGGYHSLALRKDGKVVAWGSNGDGQTTVPAGLEDVVQIAGGKYHSLALRKDGKVVVWGNNNHGQTTVPAGLEDVVQISSGGYHSLALKRKR